MKPALLIALFAAASTLLSSLSFASNPCDLFHDDFGAENGQAWICRVVDFNGRHFVATGTDLRDACAKAELDCVERSIERNCVVESYHRRGLRHRDRNIN